MDSQHYNNNNATFCVYYAKIVVRVLTHSPLAFGSWTMHQNPDYYFDIVHLKCNIIISVDEGSKGGGVSVCMQWATYVLNLNY
jgi:hypothetical protein